MLATSTHDTKLGEDARARLAVLSEMPEEWERQVKSWTRLQRAAIGGAEGDAAPGRSTEYLFYQLLVATWPPDLTLPHEIDSRELAAYAERIRTAMIKACREPKRDSSWVAPNSAYEDAVIAFIDRALDPERSQAFHTMFRPFQEWVARLGLQNSLVQTALKLTSPGVPDIYQGSELLNFSLMDPDNRRRVHFEAQPDAGSRTKRDLITTLLNYRGRHPDLFAMGDYEALTATGPGAEQVVAFGRKYEADRLTVICGRFPASREGGSLEGTILPLPDDGPRAWRDIVMDKVIVTSHEGICVSDAIRDLPIAVLVPE
jgi:(1->4)-alpha-D-glucan 1-alpha-D-glucosylmutase